MKCKIKRPANMKQIRAALAGVGICGKTIAGTNYLIIATDDLTYEAVVREVNPVFFTLRARNVFPLKKQFKKRAAEFAMAINDSFPLVKVVIGKRSVSIAVHLFCKDHTSLLFALNVAVRSLLEAIVGFRLLANFSEQNPKFKPELH